MDLQKLLAAEHSKKQCDRIVKYIGDDKTRFAGLLAAQLLCPRSSRFDTTLFQTFAGQPFPKRYTCRRYPRHAPVAAGRVLTKKFHGRVMSVCFDFLQAPDTPVAVKAFSLTVLQNLAKDYPDIGPELQLIIEEQWEHSTPAFRSRAKKLLKEMDKRATDQR